jgi:hypothetical protein
VMNSPVIFGSPVLTSRALALPGRSVPVTVVKTIPVFTPVSGLMVAIVDAPAGSISRDATIITKRLVRMRFMFL